MSTTLFGRRATVRIDRLQIDGLDVAFKIEKTLKLEPNTCEIQVWNLKRVNRAALEIFAKDAGSIPVEVIAGYEGNASRIFLGDLREVWSSREGPDWITHIKSGDGADAHKTSRINKSYGPGTPVVAVVKDAIARLGVGLGNSLEKIAHGKLRDGANQFVDTLVVSGSATRETERLLRSMGLEMSVQDGQLQVLGIGEALEGSAVLLSPDTGLVGSPEIGTGGIVKAKALLQPDLTPGRKIQIAGGTLRGFFRIEKATYTGDLAGKDWYVDVEARAL